MRGSGCSAEVAGLWQGAAMSQIADGAEISGCFHF